MRSLCAEYVIDYTREDFTGNGQPYDLIHDVKTDRSIYDYRCVLSSNRIYVTVGGRVERILLLESLGLLISMTGSKKMSLISHKSNMDIDILTDFMNRDK